MVIKMGTHVINISRTNFRLICRICYEETDLKDIYLSKYKDITFAAILQAFIPTEKISADDGLPTHACIKCIKSVLHLNAFLEQFRVSTEALKAVYNYLYNDIKQRKRCIRIDYTKIANQDSLLEKCTFAVAIKPTTVDDNAKKSTAFLKQQAFICANCDKSFHNKSLLIKHLDVSHAIIACSECGVKLTRSSLKGHLRRHRPDYVRVKSSPRKRLCSVCGVTVRYNVRAHMLAHETPKPFHCKLCPFKTAFVSSLNRHQIKHKGRMFLCNLCGKDFSRKEYFTRHMKMHEPSETPECCKICAVTSPSPFELKKHLKTHDFLAKKISNNKRFLIRKSTNDEIPNEGAIWPKCAKKCEECGKMCLNYLSYIGHMKFKHKIDKKMCKICGERIQGHMSVHMKIHVERAIHKCPLCNKLFNSNAHVKRHKLLIHENKREHKCSYCAKGFNLIGNLQDHIRTHTGDTLQCAHCQKTFKQTSARYKHLRDVHNVRLGERKGKRNFDKFALLKMGA